MANVSAPSSAPSSGQGTNETYFAALSMVTVLFFFWGFITSLNDILIPHFKAIFDLNYTRVMLIQFAFFGAYFIRDSNPSTNVPYTSSVMMMRSLRFSSTIFAIRSSVERAIE